LGILLAAAIWLPRRWHLSLSSSEDGDPDAAAVVETEAAAGAADAEMTLTDAKRPTVTNVLSLA